MNKPEQNQPDEFDDAFDDLEEPLFSVIIPCRNQAGYLRESVESLLSQGTEDFETIIVNSGSTDNSGELAAALRDEYPQLKIMLIGQEESGPAIARNVGIAAASGEWIAPLNCGDLMARGFLGKVAAAIGQYPQANAFTGAYRPFDPAEASGKNAAEAATGQWKQCSYNAESLKERCNLLSGTVYRRSLWLAAGGYDASHPFGLEDWHFWLKAQIHGFVPICLPDAMLLYRVREADRNSPDSLHQADSLALHQTMLTDVYPLETLMQAHRQLRHMAPETEAAVRLKAASLAKNPLPHFWLGLAHEGRGELEQAAACYRQALALPWPRLGQSFKSGAWQPQLRLDQLGKD